MFEGNRKCDGDVISICQWNETGRLHGYEYRRVRYGIMLEHICWRKVEETRRQKIRQLSRAESIEYLT